MRPALAPRLALCGNVFPADSLAQLSSALAGPVREWARAVRDHGGPPRPALGLYLAAAAAEQLEASAAERTALQDALARAGVEVWTANAFPFGGFHGDRVKERAFLPDWRERARLRFTERVIDLLAGLAPSGGRLSVSTCPLGYGEAACQDPQAREHLLRAQARCDLWSERRGAPVLLALEPEPDGGFERAAALCAWLAEVEGDRPSAQRRLALCWDLCHGAVVGEPAEQIVASLIDTGTPLGKIQLSAALACPGSVSAPVRERLTAFARDPYLHQARARDGSGAARAWRDLPDFLASGGAYSDLRVHCHVPLQRDDYGGGLRSTPWRADLAVLCAAVAAGRLSTAIDAEVETYTLPVLPPSARGSGSLSTLLAEETRAASGALGLDAAAAASYSLPPEAAPGSSTGPIV